MLLTITAKDENAEEISYLFHKHPDKFQTSEITVGKTHVFYPEVSKEQTTIALMLDIDPIEMVRGKRNLSGKGFSLQQYVNDKPYIASSFLSSAIIKMFSTALNGKCNNKPELVSKKYNFEISISVVSAPKGGEKLIHDLFEPLGYSLEIERHILDEKFTNWGESKYYSVTLKNEITVQDLLTHLYVLIPVLDFDKHYYVGEAEVKKLLEKGKNWLPNHPLKDLISNRYFLGFKSLQNKMYQILEEDSEEESEEISKEEKIRKKTLHQERLDVVLRKMKESNVSSVIDLGCGEGKLLKKLIKEPQFKKITGTDVSFNALSFAKEKIYFDKLNSRQLERISLFQSSLLYKDTRFSGYDAAAIVEVIEHLEESRLEHFEKAIFEHAKPKKIFLTTPNKEYNIKYEGLENGKFRHNDHRFEWTRNEFENWAEKVAEKYNYEVEFFPIGEIDEKVGASSQMGVFSLDE
ncbi:3' terminal RNA ribose 2'-O-methyltransferase Hen1 [Aureivirga sp. CE67]|uniref:3' terminal RNA ribose 2'-O-methyltransferase Hen1 n=1 Tax=Aureivirga sp. CE67 TaxID=1788983 RepID=UPI0018CA062D|nr:3' terminal RNA ribose 2'-O-methyltransferase Hen1 [Aureivirga sp. CE67]